MTLVIRDGIEFIGSRKTCERIIEAFRLYDSVKEARLSDFDDWSDYEDEMFYCYGRAALLLGLMDETEQTIECFGRI